MKVRKTAASLLVIGMAVQILMGIWWLVCNFPSQWSYPESEYYILAADSWVLDEYTGVLYPVLIKIAQVITGWVGSSFEGLLYGVQIAVAFVCHSAFVMLCRWTQGQSVRHRRELLRSGFCGLYLMTIPLTVQWHVSVLPQSFITSLFLLLLGFCVRATRNSAYCHYKLGVQAGVLWAAMTLLAPDYWWFGLIPILYVTVLAAVKKGWRLFAVFLSFALLSGALGMGINHMVQTPGSGGKIQRSLGAAMVSRMVWPNFDTNYFFWPDEVKEIMTPLEALAISSHADEVQIVFGPKVETAYGREKAEELYWQMALSCIQIRTKELAQAIGGDLIAYLAAPWQVKTQLDGSGLSHSGWNYEKMRSETPVLARRYMDYGLVSFRVGILLCVFCLIWRVVNRRMVKHKAVGSRDAKGGQCRQGPVVVLILGSAIWQALWYTMSGAGLMDYRNASVIIVIWYYGIVTAWLELRGMELADNEK